MRIHRLFIPVVAAGALALAGCGGGGDEPTTAATAESPTTNATTSADTTTVSTTVDTGSTTTSSTPVDDGSGPAGSRRYTDPGGAYSLSIDPNWTEGTSSPKLWFVADVQNGFRENVNVITENLPSKASLDEYVQASLKSAPGLITDFTVISNERIVLANGTEAKRLVYSGAVGGSPTFRFLAIVAVSDTRAATLTFTALPDRFDGSLAKVEPYARTLDVN